MPITAATGSLLLWLLCAAPTLWAETAPPTDNPDDQRQTLLREFDAAKQGMAAAKQQGPRDIALLQQAVLHLPTGFAFVPNPAAARFVTAMGNRVDDSFLGLVLPVGDGADDEVAGWIATVSFEPSGYIRDDDAKNWDTADMLKTLQEGAAEMNQTRAERGIPELELQGWAEAPAYDATTHRLVWALIVANKGAPPDEIQSVNYNTHALGREGYFSLNLVTARDSLEQRKPTAKTLLAALEFNAGKRYEDFNADTDHTAEFGLAALVGGAMVAKKLGLFALAAVFAAKFGKIIAVIAAAMFGIFGKRLGKKKGGDSGSMDA